MVPGWGARRLPSVLRACLTTRQAETWQKIIAFSLVKRRPTLASSYFPLRIPSLLSGVSRPLPHPCVPSASTPRRNGSHGSDTLTSRSSTWSPFTERAVTPRRAERASGRLAVHSQHPSRLPHRCRPARRRFSTQSPRTQRAPPARGAVPRQDPQERLSGVRRGDTSRFTPRPGGGPGLDRHPKRCARALLGPVSPAQGCRSAGPVLPRSAPTGLQPGSQG